MGEQTPREKKGIPASLSSQAAESAARRSTGRAIRVVIVKRALAETNLQTSNQHRKPTSVLLLVQILGGGFFHAYGSSMFFNS
jgi:hypothetical protein